MWKLLKRKEIYKNSWISVREDILEDEKGKEQLYGVVSIGYGSSVLPIDNEGNVYLVKQFRYGAGENTIESPGGSIDSDINPLAAAKRELKEEIGVEATEWVDLGYIRPLTAAVDHKEYLFIARGFDPTGVFEKNEEEELELIKVSLVEAVEMVMKSKIIHGPCVAIIMKAHEYFQKKK